MPNPNAIVSTTIRFDPPLGDRAPDEALRAEGGLTLELDDGRRVPLDPEDRRSIGFVKVLDELSRRRRPVYIELDPASATIARLLIPAVVRVASIRRRADDALDVELSPSHARHVLRLGGEDAEALERHLREALETGVPVLVVEDLRGGIIDVRPFIPDPEGPLPPFPEPGGPRFPPLPEREPWWWRWILWPFRKLWWWFWLPWRWFACPSPVKAQQIFDAMAATSCDPLTVSPPCIPFRYPDDGCWARANEMCRLIHDMGYAPKKVWIDSTWPAFLHVETPNHPDCFVDWGWHVAPILCVRGPKLFTTQMMVIDPSLFTTPVSQAAWKAKQNDPGATLTETDASQFWPNGGTDPTYSQTNAYLADYRLLLLNRSIQEGPPPYPCP